MNTTSGAPRKRSEHRATLPFTRVLAGGADYTPGGFANRQPSQFRTGMKPTEVQATRAGELAMFILIESPFTVACDSPEDYKDKDGKYLLGMDFLKGLPTVWDETRAWPAKLGQYVVEARRNGKNWYLAAITDRTARELPVPLKFPGQGQLESLPMGERADAGENAEHLVRNEKTVRPSDTLQLKLAPSAEPWLSSRPPSETALFRPAARRLQGQCQQSGGYSHAGQDQIYLVVAGRNVASLRGGIHQPGKMAGHEESRKPRTP